MTHPLPSPIAPGNLADDPTVAGARHLVVDRSSRAPFGQINPSTMIPYPHPCLATSPITRNRDCDGEPPRSLTGGRLRPVRPPGHLPSSLARGPAPTAPSPRHPPLVGRLGRNPPPPAHLAGNPFSFSLFHLFFLFSYIYAYIDFLCTKNSLNKL
jgi:hypothetical protein